MNKLMQKQIISDYHEMLSSEAGRRVLGGIFCWGGLNTPTGWPGAEAAAYQAGRRDLALQIANKLKEADALGVGSCELAYAEFVETYGKENDDAGRDEYSSAE